jgi:hypothetical protein
MNFCPGVRVLDSCSGGIEVVSYQHGTYNTRCGYPPGNNLTVTTFPCLIMDLCDYSVNTNTFLRVQQGGSMLDD